MSAASHFGLSERRSCNPHVHTVDQDHDRRCEHNGEESVSIFDMPSQPDAGSCTSIGPGHDC